MELSDFLRRVVPDEGFVYVAQKGEKGLRHRAFSDVGEAVPYINSQQDDGDIYFAVGSFREKLVQRDNGKWAPSRKQDNVRYLKSLFADLDCGPDKPYRTKAEALTGLKAFVSATGMPLPNIIVDSGGGVHCYWVLDRSLTREEWKPLAEGLKNCAVENAFHLDPAVTGDEARILRPIGTVNHKNGNTVKVLHNDPKAVSVKVVRELLKPFLTREVDMLTARLGKGPGVAEDNDDLSDGVAQRRVPRFMERIVTECPAMAKVLETQGEDQSEPYWNATLHLASFCDDAEDYIFTMSQGHAGYDEQNTRAKFERRKAIDRDRFGPTTCKTIGEHDPAACAACPHNGKIKSPIVLGASEMDQRPARYRLDRDGHPQTWMVLEKDEPGDWQTISHIKIGEPVATEREGDIYLQFHWSLDRMNGVAMLPYSSMGDYRAYHKALAGQGIALSGKPEIMGFMEWTMGFLNELSRRSGTVKDSKAFGWDVRDGKPAFCFGDIMFTDGKVLKMAVAAQDRKMVSDFGVVGKREEWQRAADFLCQQSSAPHLAILASSFAAPLVKFTGVTGVIVSAVSKESGYGKTSAQMVAASVWGHPTNTVHGLDDTINSVTRKIALTPNLPAYWDELRETSAVRKFAMLAFRISQGRDKNRLHADSKFNTGGSWQTILTVCSNTSVYDAILENQGGEAAYYRCFEFRVTKPEADLAAGELQLLFSKVRDNHGHVGHEYAQWLANNEDAARNAVERTMTALGKEWGQIEPERYWFAACAALLVGATIAKAKGWADIDVQALKSFLKHSLDHLRRSKRTQIEDGVVDPQTYVEDFISANKDRTITTKHLPVKGGSHETEHAEFNRNKSPVLRIATEDGIVRLVKAEFHGFLKNRLNLPNHLSIMNELRDQRILSNEQKSCLFGGTNVNDKTRVRTLDYYFEADQDLT